MKSWRRITKNCQKNTQQHQAKNLTSAGHDQTVNLSRRASTAIVTDPVNKRSGGGNVHNAARSIFGFSHADLVPDFSRIRHVVLYGRNIVESLMVKEVKAFMGALGNGMRCTYIDPRASATAASDSVAWLWAWVRRLTLPARTMRRVSSSAVSAVVLASRSSWALRSAATAFTQAL